jgi:hypothetical protein
MASIRLVCCHGRDPYPQRGLVQSFNGQFAVEAVWVEVFAWKHDFALNLRTKNAFVVDRELQRFADRPIVHVKSFIPDWIQGLVHSVRLDYWRCRLPLAVQNLTLAPHVVANKV